jgi:amino acid adenylation domain-containing protein
MIEAPQQKLREMSLLSSAEREQILGEWNDTRVDYPSHLCVHELFEQQVEHSPDAPALIFEDQTLSYRELNERANQLAHHLRERGVGPEVLVAICLPRSIEMVVGLLAVLKAGGAYLPLDGEYPVERLSFMIEDAGVGLLITDSVMLERLTFESGPQVICLDAEREAINRESGENIESGVSADNLAYVIYTSGSTGQPKGVLVEHANLLHTLSSSLSAFSPLPSDRFPLISHFSFDISLFELFLPLLCGAQSHLLAKEHVLDIAALTQTLSQMTLLHMVPSLMRQLLGHLRREGEAAVELRGMRKVFVGGEAVSGQLLGEMEEVFPEAELHVLYGPTEATIICVSEAVERGGERARGQVIGRAMRGVRVRLMDRWGNVVPEGVVGELYIGGRGVSRGYVKREEQRREKYVEVEGERYYRSGDMARYLSDGRIEYVGRADEQVKVRGYRIELGEIESVLARHSGVAECVVIASGADAEKRLVAYVVAKPGEILSTKELREYLSEQLPSYMIPAAYVMLEEMPLTRNGKVDRRALPAPEQSGIDLSESYVAPRTVAEELLVSIWREVLGVERLGVFDNFFELGGHSLLATQLVSRFRETFQTELPLRSLFEQPTVAGLASLITQEQGAFSGAPASDKLIERQKSKTLDELLLEMDEAEDDISLAELF